MNILQTINLKDIDKKLYLCFQLLIVEYKILFKNILDLWKF